MLHERPNAALDIPNTKRTSPIAVLMETIPRL
jgi:hypothetical protein